MRFCALGTNKIKKIKKNMKLKIFFFGDGQSSYYMLATIQKCETIYKDGDVQEEKLEVSDNSNI